MLISYVEPYWVVYPGSLFDKEGRFVTNIGALGQGRGEETNGWGYSVFYDCLLYTSQSFVAKRLKRLI